MGKVFIVTHEYSADNGYGDAEWESEVVAVFSTKEKAEEFIKKYANEVVYDETYDDVLRCGSLSYYEKEIDAYSEETMWWLEYKDCEKYIENEED